MPLRFGNPTPLASRIEVLHPQAFEHARLTMKAHRSRATGEARPRTVLSPAQGVGASPGQFTERSAYVGRMGAAISDGWHRSRPGRPRHRVQPERRKLWLDLPFSKLSEVL